jgi:hypothetical protein
MKSQDELGLNFRFWKVDVSQATPELDLHLQHDYC